MTIDIEMLQDLPAENQRLRERIKHLERADSEYESLCIDLQAAEARIAELTQALTAIRIGEA